MDLDFYFDFLAFYYWFPSCLQCCERFVILISTLIVFAAL